LDGGGAGFGGAGGAGAAGIVGAEGGGVAPAASGVPALSDGTGGRLVQRPLAQS
jgi:hypothetical protein